MKFYLNTQVLKVFEVKIVKQKVQFMKSHLQEMVKNFIEELLGGEDGSLVDLSGQSMGENMLMASLKKMKKV